MCKYYSSLGNRIILLADGTDYRSVADQIENLKYIEVPFKAMGMKPFRVLSVYKKVKAICRQYQIDILHVHGQCIIPIAWLCKLTMNIPFLWTNHIDAIPQPKLLALMHKVMGVPVISVSDELKNDLVQRLKFKDENLYVVYNGIDFSRYTPLNSDEKTILKRTYDVRDDEFIITELARLNHGKGQDLLIRAVDKVQQKYPEKKFHVLFAGLGNQEWFEQNVMQWAKEHGIKTTYLGFEDPRNVFGIANISVLPSLNEGFALTVMESLAMECPAIRSNTPGSLSMKNYCMIFSKGDIEGLTNSLEQMISEYPKWKALTSNFRDDIAERFSKEQMGESTLNIYRTVLSRLRRK